MDDRRNRGQGGGRYGENRERGEYRKYGENRAHGENRERGEHRKCGEDRRPRGGAKKGAGRRPEAPRKPDARDAALKALRFVARDNAYAAQALDRALSEAALSPEDRRLAASMFYFALENRLRIEHLLRDKMERRPEPEVMDVMILAAAQILYMDRVPDHAAVDEAVKQTRRARKEGSAPLVNAVLRGLIRDRDAGALALPDREEAPEKYISEKYSVAPALVERIVAAYGVDAAENIVAWSPERGVQSVRFNQMKLTAAEFEKWLSQNGFDWSRGAVPGAYRLRGAGRLAAHAGYREGVFSMQGESSMLAALAMQVRPGMQVLDACAAPGGKSCLMAEMMRGAGRVYAWDLHEHRAELIRAAARRLGLDNIRPQARDAAKVNANLLDSMDAVLVDAPCSGLGVMGDKPDIKYRLSAETIDALVPIQKEILDACAKYVRPGGRLVYATCTILPEENAAQVAAFLDRNPEFEMDGADTWLPEALRPRLQGGMIQILPDRDGLDGFFIARMRRKEARHGE